jgi:hypothetical protein
LHVIENEKEINKPVALISSLNVKKEDAALVELLPTSQNNKRDESFERHLTVRGLNTDGENGTSHRHGNTTIVTTTTVTTTTVTTSTIIQSNKSSSINDSLVDPTNTDVDTSNSLTSWAIRPSLVESIVSSAQQSVSPSKFPTFQPTHIPSRAPSVSPSRRPSSHPSWRPSLRPTPGPSSSPSSHPSVHPSFVLTRSPSMIPSSPAEPSPSPSNTQVTESVVSTNAPSLIVGNLLVSTSTNSPVTTSYTNAQALCSSNPICAALLLDGFCCPTADSVFLQCCEETVPPNQRQPEEQTTSPWMAPSPIPSQTSAPSPRIAPSPFPSMVLDYSVKPTRLLRVNDMTTAGLSPTQITDTVPYDVTAAALSGNFTVDTCTYTTAIYAHVIDYGGGDSFYVIRK